MLWAVAAMARCISCFADNEPLCDSVLAIAATNVLETWEGAYGLREVAPICDESGTTNFCLCLYGSVGAEGNLLEMYDLGPFGARTMLGANVNIKGVTPVLLQFGTCTNLTEKTFWTYWRHPGNGGCLSHVRYAHTNDIMSVIAQYEYCDVGGGKKWHLVVADDQYAPATNLCRSADVVLWTNTNTVYSSCIDVPIYNASTNAPGM